jgi:hypothetical protein
MGLKISIRATSLRFGRGRVNLERKMVIKKEAADLEPAIICDKRRTVLLRIKLFSTIM